MKTNTYVHVLVVIITIACFFLGRSSGEAATKEDWEAWQVCIMEAAEKDYDPEFAVSLCDDLYDAPTPVFPPVENPNVTHA